MAPLQQEAAQRLRAQSAQAAAADQLTRALGQHAAGAYVDSATGGLVVNVLEAPRPPRSAPPARSRSSQFRSFFQPADEALSVFGLRLV